MCSSDLDTIRAVVDAAGRGDPAARAALDRVGDWLDIGVVNLINLFNPGVVIFGGMLRDVYPGAADRVRGRVAVNVLAVSRERAHLCPGPERSMGPSPRCRQPRPRLCRPLPAGGHRPVTRGAARPWDSLDRAWRALSVLPRRELTMLPVAQLDEHLPDGAGNA